MAEADHAPSPANRSKSDSFKESNAQKSSNALARRSGLFTSTSLELQTEARSALRKLGRVATIIKTFKKREDDLDSDDEDDPAVGST
jgi:hypothetical protein